MKRDLEDTVGVSDSEVEQDNKKHKFTDTWLPSSLEVLDYNFNTLTFASPIPESITTQPVILGVDEAGRGPILGPMVYSIAYCDADFSPTLTKYGFNDSKVLKHDFRLELYKLIEKKHHELNKNVGWITTVISAKDISSGMNRVHGKGAYNLNEQAHDTTINLIRELIAKKINIKEIFIDTVGPPHKYQTKLEGIFPGIKFVVTKKADSLYPIVSAGSIVAKVTRDLYLHYFNKVDPLLKGQVIGSGYPSDPNTSRYLQASIDPVFGWHFGLVRYSWQTARDALEKNNAAEVTYEEPAVVKARKKVSVKLFGSPVLL